MEIDIVDRIVEFKPTEAYILTYSFDFNYYEKYFLPKLQGLGCHKNIVLSDAKMFSAEIDKSGISNKIGKEYILLLIFRSYAFHPKIYLFKRKEKQAIKYLFMVGSGNLGHSGLHINKELFFIDEWNGNGEVPEILSAITNYISMILAELSNNSSNAIGIWLNKGFPIKIADKDDQKRFIGYPNQISIVGQLTKLINNQKIEEISIFAPFFDYELSALKKLIDIFRTNKVSLFIQPNKVTISREILKKISAKNNNLQIFNIIDNFSRVTRYFHAKIIVLSTKKNDHVMIGSANISEQALFGTINKGNCEACIYSVLPKGVLFKEQGLDRALNKISPDQIVEKIKDQRERNADKIKLIYAEYSNGKYEFTLNNAIRLNQIEIELIRANSEKQKIHACSEKKEGSIKYVLKENVEGAVYARMNSISGQWIPIIYLNEIKELFNKEQGKIAILKDYYFESLTDDTQKHFLNKIIDILISDAINYIRKLPGTSKSLKPVTKKNNDEKIEISIKKSEINRKSREMMGVDNVNVISDGMMVLLNIIKEKGNSEANISDEMETAEKDDYEIYDEEKQQKKQVQENYVTSEKAISGKFSKRRKMYLKLNRFKEIEGYNFIQRASLLIVIALPQVSQLHKYIIENNMRKPSISDKEWEAFVCESISILNYHLFQLLREPEKMEEYMKSINKEVYLDLAASLLYLCSTVYSTINLKASFINIGYDDEVIGYRIKLNRIFIFCSLLMHCGYCQYGIDKTEIEKELTLLSEYFPCVWKIQSDMEKMVIKINKLILKGFKDKIEKITGRYTHIPREILNEILQ